MTSKTVQDTQTILSLERTIMGKERVALTEISVLLALMALGFGLIKFFEETNDWIYYLGILFVAAGLVGVFLSYRNYEAYKKKLQTIEQENHIHLK